MSQIKVGEYLFSRLKQLGVKTVFGVPGDYELALLDLIGDSGVQFAGNPNELIASYAADGYGRMNGVGAWVDTFGPGELSAYCGHAGAYTELVPVAHIVGYPGRDAMKAHAIMHHSLGTGEFGFEEMAKKISVATSVLMDPDQAPAEIDRCLNAMLYESRPCYIGVPVDMSHLPCDSAGLQTSLKTTLPPNDASEEEKMVSELRSMLEKKQSPIIIVDGNATRNGCLAECTKLSQLTGLPTFITAMGKGTVDEEASYYGGLCAGMGTHPGVKDHIESSDAVFWIGNFPSDFNTGEFTNNVAQDVIVDFQRFFIMIGSKKYDLKMKYVLQALIKSIDASPLERVSTPKVTWDPYPLNNPEKGTELTQDYLWPALGKFFRPGDYAIAETGTSAYGIGDSKLPTGASLFNQTVFGSIGFATGAATGAFQSIRETRDYKRCILVTGEGSLQLTVQTFADMLKLKLNPIVFVLNNDGYTIERLIHGKEAFYNKVPDWNYSGLAKVFGPEHPSKYWGQIKTAEELDKVLADPELNDGECFRLVELKLGYLDAPASVRQISAAVEAFNQKQRAQGASRGG